MKQALCSTLLTLLIVSPVLAQDPFESTVASASGEVLAQVRDLVPKRTPSSKQIRTYLEAARYLGLGASVRLDDGRGGSWSQFGDTKMPTGTQISVSAKFTRPTDGSSPVLSTLSIVPNQPIHTPDFVFHRLEMTKNGNLRAKLNASGRSIDLDIHKIQHDRNGNLVFSTHASNHGKLVNMFVPDIRITPDGRLQTRKKNALFGSKTWKQEKDSKGRPVTFGGTLPIKAWPPRLSDIIDLLPAEDAPAPEGGEPFAFPSLPITDLGLRTRVMTDPILLGQDDNGWLVLRDTDISLDVHGPVQDGTFTTDPERPNGFRVAGKLDGELRTDDATAKLLSLEVEVDGKVAGRAPLNDLTASEGQADLSVTVGADVSDLKVREGYGGTVDLKRAKVNLLGNTTIKIGGPKRRGIEGVLEDTHVSGDLDDLLVTEPDGSKFKVDGAHLEGMLNGRLGPDGIDRLRVKGSAEATGNTTIDLPLGEGARGAVEILPGSRLEADTGDMAPGEDGKLVSPPGARVTAHIKLQSGSAAYQSMMAADVVGGGTVDLSAALGLKIDPKALVADDGTPVIGKVPLALKLTIGFAPKSKLIFGPPGADEEDKQALTFSERTEVVVDLTGEVDPETGLASVRGVSDANVTFKGLAEDTKQLNELAQSVVMLDRFSGGKILAGAKVRFTPQGLVVKLPEGEGELKLAPSGARR